MLVIVARLAEREALLGTVSLSRVVFRSRNSREGNLRRVPALLACYSLSVCYGGTRWRSLKTRALHTCHLLSWHAHSLSGRLPFPFCKKKLLQTQLTSRAAPFWSRIPFAMSGCVGQLATLSMHFTPLSSFFFFFFLQRSAHAWWAESSAALHLLCPCVSANAGESLLVSDK